MRSSRLSPFQYVRSIQTPDVGLNRRKLAQSSRQGVNERHVSPSHVTWCSQRTNSSPVPWPPCPGRTVVDAIVDILFAVDIVINFLSTYEDPVTQIPVIDIKKIASNYITGWFLIDIIAVFPTQIIENIVTGDQSQNGHQIKLVRLARLPRLYRLIRILRMLKMIRIFRKTQ